MQAHSKIPVKRQMDAANKINGNNSITHDIENLITSPLNDADKAAIEERINNIKVNLSSIWHLFRFDGSVECWKV